MGAARLRAHPRLRGGAAVERLGLSARSLQDLARVDAQLARLPAVEAALVSGALTWTKVRLVCRVAGPADEAGWIALARRVTARELSKEVRAVDVGSLEATDPGAFETDEDGAREEPRECVRIRCTPAVRARWWSTRQLACRVAGEALPVWQAMENVAAEVLSAFPLAPSEIPDVGSMGGDDRVSAQRAANGCASQGAGTAAPSSASSAKHAANGCAGEGARMAAPSSASSVEHAANGCAGQASEATGPPPFLARLVEGLAEADAFELDARLRRAVALEQQLEHPLGVHLLAVAGRARPGSIEVYAREQLGISPRKARGLLRMARVAARVPELYAAWSAGRLSWARAQTILPALIERPEEARHWIERAVGVTVRQLEEDVEAAAVERAERHPGAQATTPDEEERREVFWQAPRDVARLFRATVCSVRRRIERATGRLPSEGEAFGAMLEHASVSWGGAWGGDGRRLPARFRVFARDGWRCTVPGCSSYRNLHDHHIRFRSAGGSDAETNRTTLCAWHHLRGVHAGRVRIAGRAPDALRFGLGLRADRPPLLSYAGDCIDHPGLRQSGPRARTASSSERSFSGAS